MVPPSPFEVDAWMELLLLSGQHAVGHCRVIACHSHDKIWVINAQCSCYSIARGPHDHHYPVRVQGM